MTTKFDAPAGMIDTVLLSGLNGDGTEEVYHWVHFSTGEIVTQRVDIKVQRDFQRDALHTALGQSLPYGVTSADALLPYFLHPHSFVVTEDHMVVVSFKQAPYFRILGPQGGRLHPPAPDFTEMLSSTNCESEPGVVVFTRVKASDRYARYLGGEGLLGGTIHAFDTLRDEEFEIATLPAFIRDTLHQVAHSPAGFFVGVDMSLDVADVRLGAADSYDPDLYFAAEFPPSGFVVVDPARGCSITRTPGTACAAHVLVDPLDPTVFYVSCHNISKWTNQVVVHGQGSLERYRYRDGTLEHEGTFTEPGYLRVTSQELFVEDGRVVAAVCGYPNRLYLIDTKTMSLVGKVTLFEIEEPKPPFACDKNTPAPLYLAVSSDRRHVVLSGATEAYVVDLAAREVVLRLPFAAPGEFAATAHIGLAPRPVAS